MSGRLLPEVKPILASGDRLSKLRIFISHGTQDNVLQYQYALDAEAYLKGMGLQPELHTYSEGHSINEQMLDDLVKWLG